jgi:DNA-binding HxlR family transcriptional regulator
MNHLEHLGSFDEIINIEKQECYGYPPRVGYRLTKPDKRLYGIIRQNDAMRT